MNNLICLSPYEGNCVTTIDLTCFLPSTRYAVFIEYANEKKLTILLELDPRIQWMRKLDWKIGHRRWIIKIKKHV